MPVPEVEAGLFVQGASGISKFVGGEGAAVQPEIIAGKEGSFYPIPMEVHDPVCFPEYSLRSADVDLLPYSGKGEDTCGHHYLHCSFVVVLGTPYFLTPTLMLDV